MADEVERVEYVFDGDVSALRTATTDAINLLKQFGTAMQKTAASTDFKASKTSVSSFNSAISATITQVNTLVKSLNKLGPDAVGTLAPQISGIQAATDTLKSTLEFLDGDLVTTSKDFKELTDYVRDSKAVFESAASKAYGMATSFKQLENLSSSAGGKIQTTMQTTAESTNTFADRASYNIQRYREEIGRLQALDFATEISSQYGRINKSARESAEVFANMGNLETLSSTYGSTLGKIIDLTDQNRVKLALFRESIQEQWRSITSAFDPVISKMQALRDKSTSALQDVTSSASTVAQAFRRIVQGESEAADSASGAASDHKSLEETVESLSSELKSETKSIENEKKKLEEKGSTLKDSRKSHLSLLQAIKSLGNSFSKETRSCKSFTDALKKAAPSTNLFKRALQALTGVTLADWFAQGVQGAINYIENLNLFTVAMGKSIDKGLAFVKQMQEIYGMDPSNLYRYAGYFYQLTDAIGMADAASASLSLSMTKAANDIASLFNVDIATVVEDLASGMQGMTRAVRKYGMDIRATTLQETAARYGLTQQVETMSEANRMALRYITMMDQVSNALHQTTTDTKGATIELGDFARNIETPANQLRIFREQLSQLGRAIGNFIVVPLSRAIAYINGFIMALRTMINFVAKSFGILNSSIADVDTSGADNVADAIGGIGDAAGSAAKKLKDLTAPFDELNILQEQAASGGGAGDAGLDDVLDPALEEAISSMELKLDNIRMKANDVRDALLEFFGFKVDAGEIISWDSSQFEENLIAKFPEWTKTIEASFDHWSEIVDGFKAVFSALGEVVSKTAGIVKSFFELFINDDTVSGFIEGLGGSLSSLAGWISRNSSTLAVVATALAGISGAILAFKKIAPAISALSKLGSALSTILGAANPVVLVVAAIIAAIALLYPYSESIQDFLGSIWDSLSVLWEYVKVILADLVKLLSRVWTNTLKPLLQNLMNAIDALFGVLNTLWKELLGPLFEDAARLFKDLWINTLSPIFEKLIGIIGGVIDILLGLWTNVLAPIVDWLIRALGPSIKTVLSAIWQGVANLVEMIGNAIDNVLTVLKGIIDFIAGVFTGDWKRAWKGLVNIFIGLVNGIITAFESAINFVITLINLGIGAIWSGIQKLINSITGVVEDIADVVGIDVDLRLTGKPPAIDKLSIGRIPELAKGGIVTSPTYLLAGEGHYDEAILPLGNSPQMEELVQRIADAVDGPDKGSSKSSPIEVRVFIGGDEYDAFTYRAAERGKKKVGAQPVTIGG